MKKNRESPGRPAAETRDAPAEVHEAATEARDPVSMASPRHAVGVDPGVRERNLKRLRRIEGQVRGLQRMVEEERYCADILTQISSVHEALRGVGRELVRNHLKHCATSAIRKGDDSAEAMYDEVVDLMYRHVR
jgi:CsoR family transcriptional regulator, copper-sensing transcriptional repressor